MKAVREIIRTYYKEFANYNTPGEYTINIPSGRYELHLVGAGGGAAGNGWEAAGCLGGGGSGAYYNGLFSLTSTQNISITIGTGGTSNVAYTPNSPRTAGSGTASTFGTIITCGGGTGGFAQSTANTRGGTGGTVTINDTLGIITKNIIVSDGQDNVYARGPYAGWSDCSGGLSVYDNTHYGYGAGGWSNNQNAIVGLAGFCKVVRISDETDYDYYRDRLIYTTRMDDEGRYYSY